jgi:hypothetical protein
LKLSKIRAESDFSQEESFILRQFLNEEMKEHPEYSMTSIDEWIRHYEKNSYMIEVLGRKREMKHFMVPMLPHH